MTKLFIVVNVDWFFLSHRLPIALEAKQRGMDVTVLAIEEENKGNEIRSHGLKFISLPSSRGGKNLFDDFRFSVFLWRIYKNEQPDIVHHVAIKPVLYGSFAARLAGVPKIVNAISGLGSSFLTKSVTTSLIKLLYRYSQSGNHISVIVQNIDDKNELKRMCRIPDSRIFLIRGSGVNISKYLYQREPQGKPIRIVLVSRMLWDKGIREFVEAAKLLRQKYGQDLEFWLVGKVDIQNDSSISEGQLLDWNKEGNVNWVGYQPDVKRLYAESHIAVLPSYREGLPKSLIEAMAIGRPIVTTDAPGCRELVNENGILVKVNDVSSLSRAIERLVLNENLRIEMGKIGREIVEKELSLNIILDQTFEIYEKT